jgi:hypothetical protein
MSVCLGLFWPFVLSRSEAPSQCNVCSFPKRDVTSETTRHFRNDASHSVVSRDSLAWIWAFCMGTVLTLSLSLTPNVLCCLVLSCAVLSCLVLPCPVLSCLGLPCPVLSCLVLSCPALSCLVLSCLVLSCLVLSCLVVSCLTPCM